MDKYGRPLSNKTPSNLVIEKPVTLKDDVNKFWDLEIIEIREEDPTEEAFSEEVQFTGKRCSVKYTRGTKKKLYKSPVKHRFIAGSSKCTTKQLSSLLTKILTVIKTGLEKYCSIKTSHTEVNNM